MRHGRVGVVLWLTWVMAAIAAAASASSLFAADAPPSGAHVVEFSPQGEIKNVR